jgi:soluble lytic murein transglycosylase-like protein
MLFTVRRVVPMLSCLAANALALVLCGSAQAQTSLSGAACAALNNGDGRLAGKFSLGHEACAGAPPAATSATPRSRQAQQLYLYEQPGLPALDTPPTPAASRRAPAARTPSRAPPRTPSRTISMRTPAERALGLAPMVDAVARTHDIDPLLLHAIARVESRHDARAVSPAGARGLMQVMPATARRFGVSGHAQLHDAATNLQVSAVYLKSLQHRFAGDLPLVLAAYNAGEGAVEKHGRRIPPYAETRGYVRGVLAEYDRLRAAQRQARAHEAGPQP